MTAPPFDLSGPVFRQDPYPFYAILRRQYPVFAVQRRVIGKVFVLSRYEDVTRVLKDDATFSNDRRTVAARDPWWTPSLFRVFQNNMVGYDGADHRRLRNLVHKAFTASRVEALSARIHQLVHQMLDELEQQSQRGPVDLISGFALPLPLTVISEMMGLSASQRRWFQRMMAGLLDLDGGGIAHLLGAMPRGTLLMHFFRRLIEQRRSHLGDDLVSSLISAEEGSDRLSAEELLNMVFLLLFAGHETTVNLIGNGVLALLENRDQLDRLRASPALVDSAIEELLRFTSPVQSPAPRFVTSDVELAGRVLPRGSRVRVFLGSANRDEAAFDKPDELDLGRAPNKHVAFGYGVHYCVGAPLARLEARHAFLGLLERFADLELAVPSSALEWRRSTALRGLASLPLRLRAASRAARANG